MTWREIQAELSKLNETQLDQKAQILPFSADGDCIIPLDPIVSFGTIGYFLEGTQKVRSSVDNKHHDEEFVLLTDSNMYDEDGSIGFDIITGERIF